MMRLRMLWMFSMDISVHVLAMHSIFARTHTSCPTANGGGCGDFLQSHIMMPLGTSPFGPLGKLMMPCRS